MKLLPDEREPNVPPIQPNTTTGGIIPVPEGLRIPRKVDLPLRPEETPKLREIEKESGPEGTRDQQENCFTRASII